MHFIAHLEGIGGDLGIDVNGDKLNLPPFITSKIKVLTIDSGLEIAHSQDLSALLEYCQKNDNAAFKIYQRGHLLIFGYNGRWQPAVTIPNEFKNSFVF